MASSAGHKHAWWIDYAGDRFCTDCSAMGMPVGFEHGNKEYVQCPCTGRTHKKGCEWYGWTFQGTADPKTGIWETHG